MYGEIPQNYDKSNIGEDNFREMQATAAARGPEAEARRQEMQRWAEKVGRYAENAAAAIRELQLQIREIAPEGTSQIELDESSRMAASLHSGRVAQEGITHNSGAEALKTLSDAGVGYGYPLTPQAEEVPGFPYQHASNVKPEEKGISYVRTEVSPPANGETMSSSNPATFTKSLEIDRSPAHINEVVEPAERPLDEE